MRRLNSAADRDIKIDSCQEPYQGMNFYINTLIEGMCLDTTKLF